MSACQRDTPKTPNRIFAYAKNDKVRQNKILQKAGICYEKIYGYGYRTRSFDFYPDED